MARKKSLVTWILLAGAAYLAGTVLAPTQTAALKAKVSGMLSGLGLGTAWAGDGSTLDSLYTSTGQAGRTPANYAPTSPATGQGIQLDMDCDASGYKVAGVDSYDKFVTVNNAYVASFVPEARWNILESLVQGYLAAGLIAELPPASPKATALLAQGL